MSVHRRIVLIVTMATVASATVAIGASAQDASPVRAIARSGRTTLTGLILDPSGAAVEGAEIMQMENGRNARSVRTGADGVFEMRQLPSGAVEFSIRKLGFKVRTLTLDVEPGCEPLVLTLEPAATHLDTVMVLAQPHVAPKLRGFFERSKLGFGAFFDSAAINKYGTTQMTKVVTRVPGVFAHSGPSSGNRTGSKDVVYMIGSTGAPCIATILIDGVRWRGYIDDDLPVDAAAAVEVYNHALDVPPALVANPGSCGAIAIWTK